MDRFLIKNMSSRLLRWFDRHGRKSLPWQHHKTPYRVWVSEIMLQQTQVATVIDYFNRFMTRFPTIQTLAKATEDEVLHQWTGLGYYSRARNLHRTAKKIVAELSGQLPDTVEALESLPGIGRSTAGAISAIAFEKRSPILDGNVKRVLTRLHGITQWADGKETLPLLWELAQSYTPQKRVADYTQAIMDLGATLCTRSQPQCGHCPFMKECLAYQHDLTTVIPASKPKKKIPVRQKTFLMIRYQKEILLTQRPAKGIWAKLWSLPEIKGTPTLAEIKKICLNELNLSVHTIKLKEPFRHTFTHFHLDITPALITLKSLPKTQAMSEGVWYNTAKPLTIGLPQPVKKLLLTMEAR